MGPRAGEGGARSTQEGSPGGGHGWGGPKEGDGGVTWRRSWVGGGGGQGQGGGRRGYLEEVMGGGEGKEGHLPKVVPRLNGVHHRPIHQ